MGEHEILRRKVESGFEDEQDAYDEFESARQRYKDVCEMLLKDMRALVADWGRGVGGDYEGQERVVFAGRMVDYLEDYIKTNFRSPLVDARDWNEMMRLWKEFRWGI